MPTCFACRICGKSGYASRDSLTKHVCSGKAEKVVEVESGAANITAPRNADVVINPVSGAQSIVPANGAIVQQAVCDQKEATVGASDKLKCPVQLCPFIADRQSKLDRHMLTKKCQALKANEMSDAGLKTTGEGVAANVPMSSLKAKQKSDVGRKSTGEGVAANVPISNLRGKQQSGVGSTTTAKLSFAAGKLPTSQMEENQVSESASTPTAKTARVATKLPVSKLRSDIASNVGVSGGRPTSSGNGRPTYGGKEGERPQKLQEKSGAGSVPVGKLSFAAGKLPTSQMKAKEMSDGGLKTTAEGVAANVPMSNLRGKQQSGVGSTTAAKSSFVAGKMPTSKTVNAVAANLSPMSYNSAHPPTHLIGEERSGQRTDMGFRNSETSLIARNREKRSINPGVVRLLRSGDSTDPVGAPSTGDRPGVSCCSDLLDSKRQDLSGASSNDEFEDALDVDLVAEDTSSKGHAKESSDFEQSGIEMRSTTGSTDENRMDLDSSGDAELLAICENESPNVSSYRDVPTPAVYESRPQTLSKWFYPVKQRDWHKLAANSMGHLEEEYDFEGIQDFSHLADKSPWDPLTDIPGEIVDVMGDGNCGYRAVSYWITGSEKYHDRIRAWTTGYMEKDPLNTIRVMFGLDEDEFKAHVEKQKAPSEFASEKELQAMAEILRTTIWTYVVRPGQQHWEGLWVPYRVGGCQSHHSLDRHAMYLQNVDEHYSVVLSVTTDRRRVLKTLKRSEDDHATHAEAASTPAHQQLPEQRSSLGVSELNLNESNDTSTKSDLLNTTTGSVRSLFGVASDRHTPVSGRMSDGNESSTSSRRARSTTRRSQFRSEIRARDADERRKKQYYENHESTVRKRARMSYEERQSAEKQRKGDAYRRKTYSARKRYNSGRWKKQPNSSGVAGLTAGERRAVLKKRRRDVRNNARRFLAAGGNKEASRSRTEKTIVNRITELVMARLRKEHRQRWNDRHDSDQMTTADVRHRRKMVVTTQQTRRAVEAGVIKAKHMRRQAWKELSALLATFKKDFAQNEEEIAKEEAAGSSRKAAVESVYGKNAYHVLTGELREPRTDAALKKYVETILPVLYGGELCGGDLDTAALTDGGDDDVVDDGQTGASTEATTDGNSPLPPVPNESEKPRTAMTRPCDADCKNPDYWALRLRNGLKKIAQCFDSSQPTTNYGRILETLLVKLTACAGCDPDDPQAMCTNSAYTGCHDCRRLMRRVGPCFPVVRTILRRVYEMRALAFYIVGIDMAFSRANWKHLNKVLLLKEMPLHLRKAVEQKSATVSLSRANLEADAIAQFGDKIEKFREDILRFPDEVCSLCRRIMFLQTDMKRAGKHGRGNKIASKEAFSATFAQHPHLPDILNLLPSAPKLHQAPISCTPPSTAAKFDQLGYARQTPTISCSSSAASVTLDVTTDEELTLCHSCREDLKANALPRFCPLNNMGVDDVPPEIACLNTYERILIQRAKVFVAVVKLQTVSKKKQPNGTLLSAMKGNAVHLPLSMEETLKHINDETQVLPAPSSLRVMVERKERPNTKTVQRSMVDMKKVQRALIKLKEINPLYRCVRIAGVDTADPVDDAVEIIEPEEKQPVVLQKRPNPSLTVKHVTVDQLLNADQRSVVKMYDSVPLVSDCELFKAQQITNQPIPSTEKKTDVYCFPHLHPNGRGGIDDDRPTKVRPTDYVKARLQHSSQRFRKDPQYLFFLTGLSVLREVQSGIYFCTKTGTKGQLTANELIQMSNQLNSEEMELRLSRLMQHVRQSSAYWAQQRGDLRCYDETFGPATFFLTLSAAEYEWPDMAEYLKWLDGLRDKSKTECERSKISRPADDPVAVMEQFKRRFDAAFKNLINPEDGKGPLGVVEHYFWRIEYQMRGAPHVHMKLWIKDAPVIGRESDEEVVEFLKDKVTCGVPDQLTSPELNRLVVKYQTHRCGASCMRFDRKSHRRHCRFGFPRPTRASMVVNSAMLTTKSGSRRTRIVELPRSNEEQRINDYNPTLLLAWKANMDLQFCGESSFVLNNYITNYVSKREKTAARDFWDRLPKSNSPYGNLLSLFRQLERSREYGAYECAARLLAQPCFGRSDLVKWLGIGLKSHRKGQLLPKAVVKELDPSSTAVFHTNWIDDYYPCRHADLEQCSLFEVFSKWDYVTPSASLKRKSDNPNLLPLTNGLGYFVKRRCEKVVKTPMIKPKDAASKEQYFQLLLMLFRPWRDEVTDLLGGCCSYQEAFNSLKGSPIFDAASRFAEGRERIDEAYRLSEKWQNEKVKAGAAEATGDAVDDDPMGSPPPSPPPTTGVVQPSTDARALLNDRQRDIYDEVLQSIESGQPIYKMVSGVAGTGKSFLIESIVAALTAKYGTRRGGPVVIITAPTGIAAFNIGGTTIHSTFSVPTRAGNPYIPLNSTNIKQQRIFWKDVKLFVVDEVSMVSNVTLRILHSRLSELFGDENVTNPPLFGGKSVLLFGDLLQLKPVKAAFCFVSTAGHPTFPSVLDPHVWDGGELSYAELTENMRQRDDAEYADLLGRVRIGSPTAADIAKLEDRRISPSDADNCNTPNFESYITVSSHPPPTRQGSTAISISDIAAKLKEMESKGVSCICLMPHTATVAEFNRQMLHDCCTDLVTILAKDANILSRGKRRPAPARPSSKKRTVADTGGLEEQLVVAKGARVMLRRNLDVGRGLVNGAVGYVTELLRTDNEVSTIRVCFPSPIGEVDIEKITVEYEIGKRIWNERTQFPLTLAWAMTIHKSQGVTVDSAIIDLGLVCFEAGMAYVALSRVRRLDQLHLIDLHPAVLDCHDDAVKEYCRLRQLATPPLPPIGAVNSIRIDHPRPKVTTRLTRQIDVADAEPAPPPPPPRNIGQSTYEPTVSHVPLANETGRRCFANAVLVCLNNLPQLFTATDQSPLYVEMQRIKSKSVSPYSARELMTVLNDRLQPGVRFGSDQQHDAGEFLMKMQEQLPDFCRDMFTYHRVSRRRCRQCGGVFFGQLSPECYLMLRFTEATADCTFAEALSRNLLGASARIHCPDCDQLTMQDSEEEIICGQQFLVVQLDLFSTSAGPDAAKRIPKRRIHGFDAKKMNIGGCDYHTVGAVIHSGDTVKSGHYKAFCRAGVSAWQLVDNRAVENRDRFVNLLKDCYLLFMTKI